MSGSGNAVREKSLVCKYSPARGRVARDRHRFKILPNHFTNLDLDQINLWHGNKAAVNVICALCQPGMMGGIKTQLLTQFLFRCPERWRLRAKWAADQAEEPLLRPLSEAGDLWPPASDSGVQPQLGPHHGVQTLAAPQVHHPRVRPLPLPHGHQSPPTQCIYR